MIDHAHPRAEPPSANHYRSGRCRCDACRLLHNEKARQWRATRKAQHAATGKHVPADKMPSAATYKNGCRCTACCKAKGAEDDEISRRLGRATGGKQVLASRTKWRIERLRRERRMLLKDIAAEVGLSQARLSRIVNHPEYVTAATEARVAEAHDRLMALPARKPLSVPTRKMEPMFENTVTATALPRAVHRDRMPMARRDQRQAGSELGGGITEVSTVIPPEVAEAARRTVASLAHDVDDARHLLGMLGLLEVAA